MNKSMKFLQDMWFGESLLLHILVESPQDIKQFVMWHGLKNETPEK